MARLSPDLSPLSDAYTQTLATVARTFQSEGIAAAQAKQSAMDMLYKQLMTQSQLLAYIDVFLYSAVAAILIIPVTFLFTASKADSLQTPP